MLPQKKVTRKSQSDLLATWMGGVGAVVGVVLGPGSSLRGIITDVLRPTQPSGNPDSEHTMSLDSPFRLMQCSNSDVEKHMSRLRLRPRESAHSNFFSLDEVDCLGGSDG